jgi:hypothetical protein
MDREFGSNHMNVHGTQNGARFGQLMFVSRNESNFHSILPALQMKKAAEAALSQNFQTPIGFAFPASIL